MTRHCQSINFSERMQNNIELLIDLIQITLRLNTDLK